jgi:DNA-binding response OmpR family regulator
MIPVRVLIVDDDPTVNFMICEILLASGFEVVGVYGAAAAFEALDHDAKLSALVTDIDLGAGFDGFAIASRARIANPHLPVVYISGSAAPRHRTEGVERSEFVQKPFKPLEFVEVLSRVVRGETGSAAAPADKPKQEMASPYVGAFSVPDSSVWI